MENLTNCQECGGETKDTWIPAENLDGAIVSICVDCGKREFTV